MGFQTSEDCAGMAAMRLMPIAIDNLHARQSLRRVSEGGVAGHGVQIMAHLSTRLGAGRTLEGARALALIFAPARAEMQERVASLAHIVVVNPSTVLVARGEVCPEI